MILSYIDEISFYVKHQAALYDLLREISVVGIH